MQRIGMKAMTLAAGIAMLAATSCGASGHRGSESADASETTGVNAEVPTFSADSAYSYLKKQVEFGPRVPNTEAHRLTADWLVAELRRHGAQVHEQKADLTAFNGTVLHARNIFARFNPQAADNRLLLMAHYDTRPWADQDPDESKHRTPLDGANDGASGVAVLLETARQIAMNNPGRGIDILFVDAEDYGTENDDQSWALGARYFAENMRKNGWTPRESILLDMVGGRNAIFPREYFSMQSAPALDQAFRNAAASAGHWNLFPDSFGGAITDDHVELIKQGVPAIDIIEYHADSGFNPHWHTMGDNLSNIDPATLGAVGQSLLQYLYSP